MTGITVHRQSHEAGRNSMPPLAESGIAPRPKVPTAEFVRVMVTTFAISSGGAGTGAHQAAFRRSVCDEMWAVTPNRPGGCF
jgi:hypothetical protein